MPTSELTMPDIMNKESGNTRRGKRRENFRRGYEGGSSWSEQKYFKGDTTKLNAVLGLITKRLDQEVTFDKLQDVLNNYVLKNFRKEEVIVEIINYINDPVSNFECKHMPDDLTEKEEESKIKMKIW